MQEKYKGILRDVYGSALYYSGITGFYYRRARNARQVWILAYHQMDGRSFRSHLLFLSRHYRIVSLREAYLMLVEECPTVSNSVALTFDDGHLSFYRQIFPVLREYHVPATTFVCTDFVGTGRLYWFDWVDAIIDQSNETQVQVAQENYRIPAGDRFDVKKAIKHQLKSMPENTKYALIQRLATQSGYRAGTVPESAQVMDWDELAEMQASGLVEIGGHTCSHPSLTHIPAPIARCEIRESRRILRERLGSEIDFFAYPNGSAQDFSPEIIRYVKEAGYRGAVTLVEGVCRPGDNPFTMRRVSTNAAFAYQSLATKMSGLWLSSGPST